MSGRDKEGGGDGEPEGRDSTTEGGGEDDGSTEKNGDDSHLHDDQKSRTLDT